MPDSTAGDASAVVEDEIPDMTTDVMCMCHPGLAARQPIAPGGVRLWGRFRVRGGVLPQRTLPRTFRGYLLGRYTRAPAFRVARTVCIGVLFVC